MIQLVRKFEGSQLNKIKIENGNIKKMEYFLQKYQHIRWVINDDFEFISSNNWWNMILMYQCNNIDTDIVSINSCFDYDMDTNHVYIKTTITEITKNLSGIIYLVIMNEIHENIFKYGSLNIHPVTIWDTYIEYIYSCYIKVPYIFKVNQII